MISDTIYVQIACQSLLFHLDNKGGIDYINSGFFSINGF
jgi:hypothetical protein